MRLLAIKNLNLAEDVLASVTKSRPQWARLVSAADHRVDRALAVLRPQAIVDHRSLLASLGWPPSLSNLSSTNVNTGKSSDVPNPLFTMRGDLKNQYSENFLALCNLQELQRRRRSRQLEGHNREIALHQPLWAIEELVNPISLASQRHFSKWVEKPEFIFALVYKLTRDFVDSMDELLQPMVDNARLAGYSCREEWISAMVTSLSTYLAKEIFPIYVGQLADDSVSGISSKAKISWLHLVDLMISFDKRVQALIGHSGVMINSREDENSQRISTLSVFCDRPDWLELWAKIELSDTFDKLNPELEDERSWKMKIHGALLVSASEDYKSPAITGTVLRCLSAAIDRCRPLPSISLRTIFIRLAGAPIITEFFNRLLHRCQEAEGLTALADEDALIKVVTSINASRYCESVLKEWCEDMFFLEMELAQDCDLGLRDNNSSGDGTAEGLDGCVFKEEIRKLEEFRIEWIEKISTVVLRGFDARCRDYMKNKRQWQETGEESGTMSKSFVVALDYLQGKISKMEGDLNEIDFVVVWRSLATGVDRLVSSGVLMSKAKFTDHGVERFESDLQVLFGVFGAWCLRPQGFFPRVSEGLKLLKMDENQLKGGIGGGKERWLKENGIRHLGVTEAEKIIKNRVFMG
ncbi:Rint1-like protein mag2 [Thalictrum thalictroides]|uniref:Rint1-like protein mag2 n=1 Tax=Thalictrum thalictroides TaxID=46969 RepID=A0A7J6X5L3_THATH|nr:Rint1-like protein mag2 [Thalictrum thalictroides]